MVFVCHQQMISIPFLKFLKMSFSNLAISKMAKKQLLLLLVVKYQVRHWQLHEKYCQITQYVVMIIFLLFFSFQCLGNLCMPKNNNKQFKKTFNPRLLTNFESEGTKFKRKKSNATRVGRPRRVRGWIKKIKKKIDQYFLSLRTRR